MAEEEFEPCLHLDALGWCLDATDEAEKATAEIIDPFHRALIHALLAQAYATLASGV